MLLLAADRERARCDEPRLQRSRRPAPRARRRARHVRPARPVRELPRRRRAPAHPDADAPGLLQTFAVHWRRLVEVVVDFVLITGAFAAAYVLQFGWHGTTNQRHMRSGHAADRDRGALPRLRPVRPLPLDLALRGRARRRRDRVRRRRLGAGRVRVHRARRIRSATSRASFFLIDALLCAAVIVASRLIERTLVTRPPLVSRPHGAAHADRRRRAHGPQPDARASRDGRRARARLRRRQPAAAAPPHRTECRSSAARTSSSGCSAPRARHRARDDPGRPARSARRDRRRLRRRGHPVPLRPARDRPRSARRHSAPGPSERAAGRAVAPRPLPRRDPVRVAALAILSLLFWEASIRQDADDLHRRARVVAALARDRSDRARGAARRADLLQVALRVS